jgi:cell division protein FtsZ
MTEEGSKVGDLINALGVTLGEPAIAVVGCGGAGSNVVHGIYWGSNRIETVAVNTDEEHLRKVDAHKRVLIGKDVTFGRDAGGFPEIGEHCAEKARHVLREALKGYDIVFVVAGMGGGTGTGVSPVVAGVAKDLNAITFALPILPFDAEGHEKMGVANKGVDRLKDVADFTVVLDNNKLARMEGTRDLPMSDAMKVIERSVMKIVQTVSNETSSYVSTLMDDITGCIDAFDEPMTLPPAEPAEEQLIHADLMPSFEGFGPNMFG